MTASINWNLVSAYMKGTNWFVLLVEAARLFCALWRCGAAPNLSRFRSHLFLDP